MGVTFENIDMYFPNIFYLFDPMLRPGFPRWHSGKVENPPADAGDPRDVCSIPGLGRTAGVGNDNPLQCSCLQCSMDRGTWGTVLGVTKSRTGLSEGAHILRPILLKFIVDFGKRYRALCVCVHMCTGHVTNMRCIVNAQYLFIE